MTAAQTPPKGKVIVFGIMFWYPLAGVTFQFLHYLLGLKRLGYDVYYVEDSGRYVYDPVLNDLSPDASGNVGMIAPILDAYGFKDHWAFRGNYPGGQNFGLSGQRIEEIYREADAFLNVTGAQEMREEHLRIPRRLYVESDPFAAQVKVVQEDSKTISILSAHNFLFTFGENLGQSDCGVPMDPRFHWLPTRQAVAMDLWKSNVEGGATFNTITTWHNKGKNIDFNGSTYYWTKDREFAKFLDLPLRRPESEFELAVAVDEQVLQLLHANRWKRVDSFELSKNCNRYQDYICGSRGEFTIARDQYVRPKTGWFSDRSCCYLAAGRPVITQETGFSKFLPSGKGLFGFSTMDEILDAVHEIESDYAGNCRAACDIAHEYFDAEKVIANMMSIAEGSASGD